MQRHLVAKWRSETGSRGKCRTTSFDCSKHLYMNCCRSRWFCRSACHWMPNAMCIRPHPTASPARWPSIRIGDTQMPVLSERFQPNHYRFEPNRFRWCPDFSHGRPQMKSADSLPIEWTHCPRIVAWQNRDTKTNRKTWARFREAVATIISQSPSIEISWCRRRFACYLHHSNDCYCFYCYAASSRRHCPNWICRCRVLSNVYY